MQYSGRSLTSIKTDRGRVDVYLTEQIGGIFIRRVKGNYLYLKIKIINPALIY